MVSTSVNTLSSLQYEVTLLFEKIIYGYKEILDDLFFMRLELEAGEIPVLTPSFEYISTNSSIVFLPPTPSSYDDSLASLNHMVAIAESE